MTITTPEEVRYTTIPSHRTKAPVKSALKASKMVVSCLFRSIDRSIDILSLSVPILVPIYIDIYISLAIAVTVVIPDTRSTSIRLSPILRHPHRLRSEILFDDLPIADPLQPSSLLLSLFSRSSLVIRHWQFVASCFSDLFGSSYDCDTSDRISVFIYRTTA
jgi:hypothetical protein